MTMTSQEFNQLKRRLDLLREINRVGLVKNCPECRENVQKQIEVILEYLEDTSRTLVVRP